MGSGRRRKTRGRRKKRREKDNDWIAAGTSKGRVCAEGGVASAQNKPDLVAYWSLLTLTRAVG